MSSLGDENIVTNQFDGLNTVLAQVPRQSGPKYVKEEVDIIEWLDNHGSSDKVIASGFEGSEEHRGVISPDKVQFEELQYDYELVHVYIPKDLYADVIWHATANLLRGMRSAVILERTNDIRPGFGGNILTVIVKLDRRVTYRVWRLINNAFRGWLSDSLKEQGKKLRTSGHRAAFSGLNFTMRDPLPEKSLDEDKQRAYKMNLISIHGCKGSEVIISTVNHPYEIVTDDMESYLKALPQQVIPDPEHWYTRMSGKEKEDADGNVYTVWNRHNYTNGFLALSGKLPGLIRENSMQQLLEITRTLDDTTFGNRVDPGVLDKNSLTGLKIWLDHGGAGQPLEISTNNLTEIVNQIGNLNKYNPFLTYLNSLPKWDGKPRIDSMFSDSLGVADTPLSRYLGQLVTIGMIQMNRFPGTKCDVVIDLVGDQGTGKTSLIEKLSNSFGSKKGEKKDKYWWRGDMGWYTDHFNGLTSKDDQQMMTGRLYLNDDEFRVSRHTDPEDIKKFASDTSLSYRKAYDINGSTYYRTFILFRTTNKMEIYRSKIGQRKFWPMIVHKDAITTPVMGSDKFWTPAWVDQIWAEALFKYRQMGSVKVAELIRKSGSDETYADLRDIEHISLQHTDDTTITLVGIVYDAMTDNNIKPGQKVRFATPQLINKLGIQGDISKRELTRKIKAIMCNDLKFIHGRVSYSGGKKAGYISTDESYDAVMKSAQAYGVLNEGAAIELDDDEPHDVGLEPAEEQAASLNK